MAYLSPPKNCAEQSMMIQLSVAYIIIGMKIGIWVASIIWYQDNTGPYDGWLKNENNWVIHHNQNCTYENCMHLMQNQNAGKWCIC